MTKDERTASQGPTFQKRVLKCDCMLITFCKNQSKAFINNDLSSTFDPLALNMLVQLSRKV